MAGHSKWSNIKRKKEKTDAQRAKVFTKIGREISVAVKQGGGADPEQNAQLRDAIANAKANNVPNDNIQRVIKKAVGDASGDNFENMQYEGYGPGGIAVIVETLTDNRNRTAGDLRHFFDKYGGNLGTTGCVAYMFEKKGILVIDSENLEEDTVMEHALDAGASDFLVDQGIFEVITSPEDFTAVRDAMEKLGYNFLSAQIEQVADNYTQLQDNDQTDSMEKLLEMLEDNDDVQNVWHNWENDIE